MREEETSLITGAKLSFESVQDEKQKDYWLEFKKSEEYRFKNECVFANYKRVLDPNGKYVCLLTDVRVTSKMSHELTNI